MVYFIRLNICDVTNCTFPYPLRLCIIIIINLEINACSAGFDLYQEAKNYMTKIVTISLVPEIDWWCQTPLPPLKKNSTDLGDLEKWPKLHWGNHSPV